MARKSAGAGERSITNASSEALFARWAGCRHILVAVSGGPDSMALLHMLSQWRKAHATVAVNAATVDHGLRPQAASEARQVSAFAKSLGVAHKTLRWKHAGQSSAIQERARAARYELLAAHASRIGADILMTAHHADDQAETILFRLIRGSGIGGLSGMARERPLDGLILARPLLYLRKAELVDYCHTRGIAFAEDVSNADVRFARPRLRALMPQLEREGLDTDAWARLARRASRSEAALSRAADAAAEICLTKTAGGAITVDFAILSKEPEEIVLRVLVNAIAMAAPGNAIRLERAEGLLERLINARTQGKRLAATLGGAQVTLSAAGRLTLTREPARRRGH